MGLAAAGVFGPYLRPCLWNFWLTPDDVATVRDVGFGLPLGYRGLSDRKLRFMLVWAA